VSLPGGSGIRPSGVHSALASRGRHDAGPIIRPVAGSILNVEVFGIPFGLGPEMSGVAAAFTWGTSVAT